MKGRDSIDAIILTGVLFTLVYLVSALHKHNFINKIRSHRSIRKN